MTSSAERYVALDLGAESGRAMLGSLADGRLVLQEVQRFANEPVRVGDSLHWDSLRLWHEIKGALARVGAEYGPDIAGIGVDTWGVDFGLVDERGSLLGMPYHYRDSRTDGILAKVLERIPAWELYQEVGNAEFGISTLCQLLAMREQRSPALEAAHRLLMTPDLFNYWLCGRQATEETIAGTTQFFDLRTRGWHRDLLSRLDLPSGLPGELLPTATVLGPLLPSVAKEVGLDPVPIIIPACHDTSSAFAATPTQEASFTAISSGTWSIIGCELAQPLLSKEAMDAQYLNETAARGKTLLARNSTGLWPLQECRREWHSARHDWSYADLTDMASGAAPFTALLDPDAAEFTKPGAMTARIAAFCRRTGQTEPPDPAAAVRALLEGLALRYRKSVTDLEILTGRPTQLIHILGGGSRNRLLCQFTADATRCPVLAGPAEATAAANVLLQALARGSLSSLAEVRAVVSRSFETLLYEPHADSDWDQAYARFLLLS